METGLTTPTAGVGQGGRGGYLSMPDHLDQRVAVATGHARAAHIEPSPAAQCYPFPGIAAQPQSPYTIA